MKSAGLESKCKVCGGVDGNQDFYPREMMFGFRETFRYFQCRSCGCLQIAQVPQDLGRYYPSEYLAYAPVRQGPASQRSWVMRKLAAKRNEAALFHRGLFGRLLNKLRPLPPTNANRVSEQIGLRRLGKRSWSLISSILDVGCGNGAALLFLSELGFEDLWGVDLFLPNEPTCSNGIRIRKKSIHDLDQRFDIVTLHHSFEHMPDPLEVLCSVRRILSDDGLCLIRIPVANSYAWERYGIHWVQLDAPRHLFIHSVESVKILAAQAGLQIEEVVWDSTEFQFWGSEQYLRDIPYMDDASYAINPAKSIFSVEETENFRMKAKELNMLGRGDQAAFFLSKRLTSSREVAQQMSEDVQPLKNIDERNR